MAKEYIYFLLLLISCNSTSKEIKGITKSMGFSTIDNSKIIQIEKDSSNVYTGIYVNLKLDEQMKGNLFRFWRLNSIFYFDNNLFIVESYDKNARIYKGELFDFSLKEGESKKLIENDVYLGKRIREIKLHKIQKLNEDTLYCFESKYQNELFEDIGRTRTQTRYYYSPVHFFIVSKKTGIIGEAMGAVEQNLNSLKYWYSNGLFKSDYFYRNELKWEKVNLL